MKVCSEEGCENPAHGRGYCGKHYARWLKNGHMNLIRAENGSGLTFLQWSITQPNNDDDPCIIWPYGTIPQGYGKFSLAGIHTTAPVYACTLRYGPCPPGMECCHGPCNNRLCVSHVRWDTSAQNNADKVRDGTSNRGERCGTSKLTEEEIFQIIELRNQGLTNRAIAAIFDSRPQTISSIVNGYTWTWLTGLTQSGKRRK